MEGGRERRESARARERERASERMSVSEKREREREIEREGQKERDRDRETGRERDRETERDREGQRETERESNATGVTHPSSTCALRIQQGKNFGNAARKISRARKGGEQFEQRVKWAIKLLPPAIDKGIEVRGGTRGC